MVSLDHLPSNPTQIMMNGSLTTFFAVAAYGALHSLLASKRVKCFIRQRFGPTSDRLYRVVFNIVGSLTLLPVLLIPLLNPGATIYKLSWPWSVLALSGQVTALLILAIGLLQTDLWHFLGLRQLVQTNKSPTPKLVVDGLYRWVRHPLYTAGLIFIWLTPLMTTSILTLNLGFSIYIYIGSLLEERRLRVEFGQAYIDYQQRVPRLLPISLCKPRYR